MRNVHEKVLAVFMILVVFFRVCTAAGMEMGGFDIEVGVGGQSDFPGSESFDEDGGSPSDSGSIQNNDELSSGGGEPDDNSTSNTTESGQKNPAVSESGGQNVSVPVQNSEQNASVSSQSIGQNAPVSDQSTGQNTIAPIENNGQTASASSHNTEKNESAFGEYSVQKKNRQNKKQNRQISSYETKRSSGSNADISGKKSASGDTVSPSPVPTVTLTPNPEPSPVPTVTLIPNPEPSPVPELFFYQKKTDDEIFKKELEIYYHKEIVSDSGVSPAFLILSDSPISVLSVRINEEESLWHWEGSSLVLDAKEVQEDSCVELITLYEKGSKIRMVPVHSGYSAVCVNRILA